MKKNGIKLKTYKMIVIILKEELGIQQLNIIIIYFILEELNINKK